MLFAKEPYLLHLLAGSTSLHALDAVKTLLDSGSHNANEREPVDNLSPLHVAAAWDNLAMVQLLIHYGADVNAEDIDKRRPVDMATGQSLRFLNKFKKKRRLLTKILTDLFRRRSSSRHNKAQPSPKDTSAGKLDFANARSIIRDSFSPSLHQRQMDIPSIDSDLQAASASASTYETAVGSNNTSNNTTRMPLPALKRSSSEPCESDFLTSDKSGCTDGPIINGSSSCSIAMSMAFKEEFALLSITELRQKLTERKCSIGPIDERNRRIYENRLAKLVVGTQSDTQIGQAVPCYSAALRRKIADNQFNTKSTQVMGQREEQQVRAAYLISDGKQEVSFFSYLLIDPSMLAADTSECSLQEFIASIFYVGKGNRSRPLQHLLPTYKKTDSEKLTRIHRLWDMNLGVITLHISQNIHSEEAFTREAAMIAAIGIENLTNKKRGNLKGIARTWTSLQLCEFGAMLLAKAHIVFQNERCRPVMEADIAAIHSKFI